MERLPVRWPNKEVDVVFPALVNNGGNVAVIQNVEPSADKRIAGVSEIDYLGRVIELAREPRLDRVLVGRGDIHEMVHLQRADMVCNGVLVELGNSVRVEKGRRQDEEHGNGHSYGGKRPRR